MYCIQNEIKRNIAKIEIQIVTGIIMKYLFSLIALLLQINLLGNAFDDGVAAIKKKQFDKAAVLFNKACKGGYPEGCFYLGAMYSSGAGVEQNNMKAFDLYTKACDGGYATACNNLGGIFDIGRGINQDKVQAVNFYTKACYLEDALGCKNLGVQYESGKSVKQNSSRAMQLYGKACKLGDATGCEYFFDLKRRGYQPSNETFLYVSATPINTIENLSVEPLKKTLPMSEKYKTAPQLKTTDLHLYNITKIDKFRNSSEQIMVESSSGNFALPKNVFESAEILNFTAELNNQKNKALQ